MSTYAYRAGKYVKVGTEEFWLTADEYDEFAAMNESCPDTDEGNKRFFDWWDHLKKAKGLRPRVLFDYHPKKGGSLSSWWQGGGGWGSWSGWGDNTRKLATGAQAINNVIRIVDDTVPPMSVEFASRDHPDSESFGENFTDFEGRRIVINPSPITKPGKLTPAEGVDICIGLALHEASHSQYSRPRAKQLRESTMLRPKAVAAFLANVIEDVRIEGLTSKEYPGFAGYFRKALDWVWDEQQKKGVKLPEAWDSLANALNSIIVAVKWPEHEKKLDPAIRAELEWWHTWNERYQSDSIGLREAVEEGLARLAANEQLQQEMQNLQKETAGESLVGALRNFLKAHPEVMEGCGHADRKDLLEDEEAETVNTLIKEKMHSYEPRTTHGSDPPKVYIRRPLETAQSRAAYIGRPAGLVARYAAALRFRPELPRYSERLQKEGAIDEEELWRWKIDDWRVFQKQIVEEYPKAQVGFLCDMSGSMGMGHASGVSKVAVAQRLAQLFVEALRDMPGITCYVWGHTGDISHEDDRGSAEFYQLWEPGDPLTRLGLISSMEMGNNYDGYAIEWCTEQLKAKGQPDDQRLLIVLSDGYPAGATYGDTEAEHHVRLVTDTAEKHGVFVLQVAIDRSLRADAQSRMFRHWTNFENEVNLPRALTKELSRLLTAGSVGAS